MRIPFTKMHGLGNDFVVVDATRKPFPADPLLLHRLTDRRFGVGCDQVLLIEPAPAGDVDFGYRIYNADGSESGQCGNGARCLARYIHEHGLSQASQLRVRTRTATMELELLDDGRVRVNMGVPQFEPAAVPLAFKARALRYALDLDLDLDLDHREVEFGAVSMGNPHAVIEVKDVDGAPVATIGPALQKSPAFPEGVNVGFLQIVDERYARLRVYERGAGETLACGSGACAAMAVLRMQDRVAESVDVRLPGGHLRIDWKGPGRSLWMTGPAAFVYEGQCTLPE